SSRPSPSSPWWSPTSAPAVAPGPPAKPAPRDRRCLGREVGTIDAAAVRSVTAASLDCLAGLHTGGGAELDSPSGRLRHRRGAGTPPAPRCARAVGAAARAATGGAGGAGPRRVGGGRRRRHLRTGGPPAGRGHPPAGRAPGGARSPPPVG